MRSFLLVTVSALALAGLFVLYWTMQPVTSGRISNPRESPARAPQGEREQANDKDDERLKSFHSGKRIWMKRYDARGDLASAFSATHYQPQKDGDILVTAPVAEFFLANHQHLEVSGTRGVITMKDPPELDGRPGGKNATAPPERGQLFDVKMVLTNDAPEPGEEQVVLTMRTNNVAFDNETFRITTEAFTDPASGQQVADDQVPVQVRGQYDFDGRGLTVRWNDKDGRLELLEIAHGERLVIHDPDATTGMPGGHKKPRPAGALGAVGAVGPALAAPLPVMLAAKDKAAEKEVIGLAAKGPGRSKRASAAGSQPSAPSPPPVYVATFDQDVTITQGRQVLIKAERMDVNFLLKQEKPASPTTGPTTSAATTAPAAAAETATAAAPATGPATAAGEPSTEPSSQPSTQEARKKKEPVEIRWTGMLRITPVRSEPLAALGPGEAAVRLSGSPVSVHYLEEDGKGAGDIRCASLLYQNPVGRIALRHSEQFPLVLLTRTPGAASKGGQATRIESETLDYLPPELAGAGPKRGHAVLGGRGHADVPLEPDERPGTNDAAASDDPLQDRPPEPQWLLASWARGADLYFARDDSGRDTTKGAAAERRSSPQDRMEIERAVLTGDVDVNHPRLSLKSQVLELLFDRPAKPEAQPRQVADASDEASGAGDAAPATRPAAAAQPNLKEVIATDNVLCELRDSAAKKQMIECGNLRLQTDKAHGKLYARQVDAGGGVHAWGEDDLVAGQVALTLLPPKPAGEARTIKDGLPATRPAERADDFDAGQLETMVATDHVVANSKDGSRAAGDEMRVTTEHGAQNVRLSGKAGASVTDKAGNVVSGPTILMLSGENRARVIGPGKLHLARSEPTTQPATRPAPGAAAASGPDGKKHPPTDVTWADGAELNGPASRIDVFGKVVAVITEDDGTVQTARGQHIRIDLRPKTPAPLRPQAGGRPAGVATASNAPAAVKAASAATQPTSRHREQRPGTQMNLFQDKELYAATLDGNAVVESTLSAADGTILLQRELTAPLIRFSVVGPRGEPGNSLLVPSAGRMLVRNHRPPDKRPNAQRPAGNEADSAGDARGAMAFQWGRQLLYTEASKRAVMSGNVVAVYQEDPREMKDPGTGRVTAKQPTPPVRLNTDQLTAHFTDPPKSAPKPAPGRRDAKAGDPANHPAAARVKDIVAEGNVVVTRGPVELTAQQMRFDPDRHLLTAVGPDGNPAAFTEVGASQYITADEIRMDTQTWEPHFTRAVAHLQTAQKGAPVGKDKGDNRIDAGNGGNVDPRKRADQGKARNGR